MDTGYIFFLISLYTAFGFGYLTGYKGGLHEADFAARKRGVAKPLKDKVYLFLAGYVALIFFTLLGAI